MLLRFGVISDTHVRLAQGGETLNPKMDTRALEDALLWYRDQGVDAVVIAGDLTDCGLRGELKAVADTWFKVFPGDMAPNGRKVERIFVLGNHDAYGTKLGTKVFKDRAALVRESIQTDPQSVWKECFGEDFEPFFVKTVKGYDFFCAHWAFGAWCNGYAETACSGGEDFFRSEMAKRGKAKPFFYVQHSHPRDTVYGVNAWGKDDGSATRLLSDYPQAIAFSGHSHEPLSNEKAFWRGPFTSVATGSLRYLAASAVWNFEHTPGYENGNCNYYIEGVTTEQRPQYTARYDAPKTMEAKCTRHDIHVGMLVDVFADRVELSKREFVRGLPIEEPWIVPVPYAPLDFETRARTAKSPQFPDGSTLKTSFTNATTRGMMAHGIEIPVEVKPSLRLDFPAAAIDGPVIEYEIAAEGADGTHFATRICAIGALYPRKHRKFRQPEFAIIAFDRFPADAKTVRVTPLDSFGNRGRPIEAAIHLAQPAADAETEVEAMGAVGEVLHGGEVCFSIGGEWIPVENLKNIEKGSALDFSQMPYFDAPAGKHGRVVIRNGHFEFERMPGVAQRFYGVNVCQGACFPDHDLADEFAERVARLGFNSVRLHHHDSGCSAEGDGRIRLNAENMDKFDYLVSALVKRGIYLETDLFVSRGPLKWRDLGIDRDGDAEKYSRRALMTFYKPAYSNWCAFARSFLTHRNPYTGRTYAEEPAWVGIGLVNEGRFVYPFNELPELEPFQKAWRKWIAERRAKDPTCYPELGANTDCYPEVQWKDQQDMTIPQACCDFTADLDRDFVKAAGKFIREELGCRAPISNNNNSAPYAAMLKVRAEEYDFCDTHNYSGGEGSLDLPTNVGADNPLRPVESAFVTAAWKRIQGKPFAMTEMNFTQPSPFRAGGIFMVGALAARQEWDAIWHFAYAHSVEKLKEGGTGGGRYDLAVDALNLAASRLPLLLFLRGDLKPAADACALVLDDAAIHPPSGYGQYPNLAWGAQAIWNTRCGSTIPGRIPEGAKAYPLMDVYDRIKPPFEASADSQVSFDGNRGALSVDTPLTDGGFAPSGKIAAGSLGVDLGECHGTAFVSSLDGLPVEKSKRMLFSLLGDVQRNGVEYADEARRVMTKRGDAAMQIVRVQTARVRLKIRDDGNFRIYPLDMSGRRVGEIPCKIDDGVLSFSACTRGPDGKGVLAWEIVR